MILGIGVITPSLVLCSDLPSKATFGDIVYTSSRHTALFDTLLVATHSALSLSEKKGKRIVRNHASVFYNRDYQNCRRHAC
jgi:hypothetical protein